MIDIVENDFDEAYLFGQIDGSFGGDGDALVERLVQAVSAAKQANFETPVSLNYFMQRFTQATSCRRKLAVAATARFISLDEDFRYSVADADAKRDARNWSAGEAAYYQALRRYPLCAGYYIQYGHCLKEQNKWEDAELTYRTAWSLGETSDDLFEHIAFVSRQRNANLNRSTLEAIRRYWADPSRSGGLLDAPPVRQDVETLFRAFLARSYYAFHEICAVMNNAPTNATALELIVRQPEFASVNRDLMAVIAESKGNAA
ncbi:hypothetical protein [Bosea sp. 117]|uniref:hypothetical protein n=1 Tax=Bosea sp. 117 TaxID=1125973 RepID=UPI000493D337|nr:hypothetical protein [Bosea sp. 117]